MHKTHVLGKVKHERTFGDNRSCCLRAIVIRVVAFVVHNCHDDGDTIQGYDRRQNCDNCTIVVHRNLTDEREFLIRG